MSQEHLDLDSLQGWMQEKLIYPGQKSAGDIEKVVKASSRQSAADRLAIYQRSYYLRLIRCMEEQFPALCHALGKDLFGDFASQFLRARPSSSYTLYELGKRFPAHLEETRPDKDEPEDKQEDWIAFMIELAQFEREVFVMFDAPGHEGKPYADMDVPSGRLRLQPCFGLHQSRFPVAWYYHEVRLDNDPTLPHVEPSSVALVRRDFLTRIVPLTPVHYEFLSELIRGKSIGQSLETVARHVGKIRRRSFRSMGESWGRSKNLDRGRILR